MLYRAQIKHLMKAPPWSLSALADPLPSFDSYAEEYLWSGMAR